MVAIDFRAQNGFLYGLGFNSVAGTVTLYAISHRTGVATAVGATGAFVDAGGNPAPITGGSFGFDFNPAADRLRVVTNTGQNFRINPNTGAFVDGDLGGAAGSVAGLNMDGPINGPAASADAAAYTNNQPNNGAITTLYTLSAVTNTLYIQNPPNAGTQTVGQPLTLSGNPLDFTTVNGFDIPPGVNAAITNGPVATGSGFAALSVGGVTSLYSINLVNGNAVLIGTIGNGASAVQGLALQGEVVPGGLPAIAITADSMVRFNTATPGTTTTQAVGGLVPSESLVGIDWRPQTGQLFALGFNAANGTGSATLCSHRSADRRGLDRRGGRRHCQRRGAPISLAGATSFGFDFNPTVDRIRIVTDNGINFRVNPNTGALVLAVDGNINGLPPGSTGVTGAAYTNSFGQSLTGGVTTLYTLDATSNRLFIQNPPNNGLQTMGLAVTLGGTPVDFTNATGFDIPGDVSVSYLEHRRHRACVRPTGRGRRDPAVHHRVEHRRIHTDRRHRRRRPRDHRTHAGRGRKECDDHDADVIGESGRGRSGRDVHGDRHAGERDGHCRVHRQRRVDRGLQRPADRRRRRDLHDHVGRVGKRLDRGVIRRERHPPRLDIRAARADREPDRDDDDARRAHGSGQSRRSRALRRLARAHDDADGDRDVPASTALSRPRFR